MNHRRFSVVLLIPYCFTCNPLFAQDEQPALQSGEDVSRMLEEPQALRWVPGQVIVKFRDVPDDTQDERLGVMGYTEHVRTTGGGEYIYAQTAARISTLSAEEVQVQAQAAVTQMGEEDDVEYAQLNYIMHIVRVPDDLGFAQQWHYRDSGTGNDEAPGGINLPRAWERNVGSAESVIAVIDTGILPEHPDIDGSSNLSPGFDMISDQFTANDGDGRDDDPTDPGDGVNAGECGAGSPAEPDSWHGTHVAGTIGVGRTNNGIGISGVNWSSPVLPIRALGRCGGSIADINDAIRWAAGLPVPGVATNSNPARVINMSLGAGAPCSASPATQSAINDVVAAGTTVVVAAGNEAADAANSFPASCDKVITVAASDFNGELVTRYSNFGPAVDIMAPGGDLRADEDNDGNPDGVLSMVDGGYAFFNGTSMAAPHVAGVAGLLLAQDASLSPQDIETLIKSNAAARNAAQCPRSCGAGLLNADIDVNPPAEVPFLLSVSPTEFELDEGESATLRITLSQRGSSVASETVRIRSSNVDVVTVSPASTTTGTDGRAEATVTATSEGDASLIVSVADQAQTAPVSVTIRVVPSIGMIAAMLLAILIGMFGFRRLRPNSNRVVR